MIFRKHFNHEIHVFTVTIRKFFFIKLLVKSDWHNCNMDGSDKELERLKDFLDRDDGHEVERHQQLIHGLWSGTSDLQLPEDRPSGQVRSQGSLF